MLYTKPANMTYSDIAIFIDNNKKEDIDEDTFIGYIYLLCDMLTRKRGYFKDASEREDFSAYLAYIIFKRYDMEPRPKSVMNYIKSIIAYKKADYMREFWQENITPVITGNTDYDCQIDNVYFNDELRKVEFEDYLSSIYSVIERVVRERTNDDNVLISVLLSYLDRITLPSRALKRINDINRSEFVRNKAYEEEMECMRNCSHCILFRTNDAVLVSELLEESMNRIEEDMVSHINEDYYKSYECMGDIKADFVSCMMEDDFDSELNGGFDYD